MGTFGHNDPRDNWFYSDGAIDNQAWDDAISVATTGRITQLTAYMAGDLASIHGGPALWSGGGSLLLYTEQAIARRSAPYTGGFDGTGRNQNDGYYINTYGFSHTFTNPTSFFVGAFRRSGDSWILGFDDHDTNFGNLKLVSGSTPGTATGGNTWSHETGGYNGGVMAYATYTGLGMFARVGGVFVPVTGKRFHDTTTTYFATVLADNPLRYHRLSEATGGPYFDYGSYGKDATNWLGGPTADISGLIVDPDHATRFGLGSGGVQANAGTPGDAWGRSGPIEQSWEFWIKVRSASWDNPGAGGQGPVVGGTTSNTGYGGGSGILSGSTNSHFGSDDGVHKGDLIRVILTTALFGAGNETGCDLLFTNAMTGGYNVTHHVVVTYDSGGFRGWDIEGRGFIVGTGTLKVYVDGALFGTQSIDGFQPQSIGTDNAPWGDWKYVIGQSLGFSNRDFDLDEVAWYGYVLSPTQIAHHNAVGRGSSGGLVSTSAVYYVRNDANTAWQRLNIVARRQEMPEKREFPIRAIYPDGNYEDLLGRWDDHESTFGVGRREWDRARSGIYVPSRRLMTA
jgi:hypothetical protein